MSLEVLIQTVGYPLVFLLIMGESAGVPMPGETAVLIAAGAAGAGKGFNIWLVFLFASAGAIVGDTIGYWIGRRGGRALLGRLSGKLWFKKDHIEKAELFFARHGGKAVFFGRSVSYLRVLTALMAGVSRMYYPRFLFYNAMGGITWAAVVSFVGYKFGRHLPFVEKVIDEIGWGVLIAVLCIAAVYYASRKFGWLPAGKGRKTKDQGP
jgi:membrane protein DedA with SNARE-associated domain